MKRLMESSPEQTGNVKQLVKRGVAVGSSALAISLGLGACSSEAQPVEPTVDPVATAQQEEIARVKHVSETIAQAYECSIVPDPIYEIAPERDEEKRRLKYGWIGVKLNVAMPSKEAVELNKIYNPKLSKKDHLNYKQDVPVAMPFPVEEPFKDLNKVDITADIFPRMNQKLEQKEDGSATIEYNISYLPPEEGKEVKDINIGIVMDTWSVQGDKGVRSRGAAICGRIHAGDKGWEIVQTDPEAKKEKGFVTMTGPANLPLLPGENPKLPDLSAPDEKKAEEKPAEKKPAPVQTPPR